MAKINTMKAYGAHLYVSFALSILALVIIIAGMILQRGPVPMIVGGVILFLASYRTNRLSRQYRDMAKKKYDAINNEIKKAK